MINFRVGKTQGSVHWKNIHPFMDRIQVTKTLNFCYLYQSEYDGNKWKVSKFKQIVKQEESK
jgi:hypothetical protein